MKLNKNTEKIIWGVLFVLAALYIILGNFIMPDIGIIKIVLTIFFIWVLIKGIIRMNFVEILFPIAFLFIIYDNILDFFNLSPFSILCAALLGSIGLSMIFKKKPAYNNFNSSTSYSTAGASADNGNATSYTGDEVKFDNNFGTSIKYVTSDNFYSASLNNNFGSLTVYFDNAVIQSGHAQIDIDNTFGETKIFIPKEWKTENYLEHSFGNVKISGRMEGSSNNILTLNGETTFGEICIFFV